MSTPPRTCPSCGHPTKDSTVKNTLRSLLVMAMITLAASAGTPDAKAGTGTYTLVIGDSLTAMGKDDLLRYRPDWHIDGLSGRNVTELPERIDTVIQRNGGVDPEVLVVALGTNSHPDWTGSSYQVAWKKLPNTRIVFVTPYRDPVKYPDQAPRLSLYAHDMIYHSNDRNRVCAAPWAEIAASNPSGLLVDGVHGTEYGQDRWAREIIAAVDDCNRLEP